MEGSLASKIRAANAALIADGDVEAVGEFFTTDYVARVTRRDHTGGHEFIREFLHSLRRAFGDLQVEVEIFLEVESRVGWQRTLEGTHQGTFKGFPASSRRIVWRDVITSDFRDGLIAEEWVISDLAERLLLARKR